MGFIENKKNTKQSNDKKIPHNIEKELIDELSKYLSIAKKYIEDAEKHIKTEQIITDDLMFAIVGIQTARIIADNILGIYTTNIWKKILPEIVHEKIKELNEKYNIKLYYYWLY